MTATEEDIRALTDCCRALQNEIVTLKDCCETLRSEIFALKECFQATKDRSHPLKDRCEILQNENKQLESKWMQFGSIVAGGHGYGNDLNQLWDAHGLSVDDDHRTIYIADSNNHRILAWNYGASKGQVVAGGNGKGDRNDQLNFPRNVIVDSKTDCVIICDWGNRRVVRWPRKDGVSGEIIISNIECFGGLTMDDNGSLYVSDFQNNEVKRWRKGEVHGTIVAGGNGGGNNLNQLNGPTYLFVDRNHSIYISDKDNHRVMMWKEGAQEGSIVAGGRSKGNDLTHLTYPYGLVVDPSGALYIADSWNNRIMCWLKGAREGSIVIGGNGEGGQSNQFNYPIGLSFDRQGNLYAADSYNQRVVKFQLK